MRKIFILLFAMLNTFNITSCAISAQSAVLIDASSGRVLYEHNAYQRLPMASTTKIMTGLLACESGMMAQNVKTSAYASGTEGSSLWLKIGEKQTLENLTYGLMLKSGNDAAVAIAEFLGGSVDAFSVLMNKRAREIGARDTNFINPHGLDAEGHYTTAYDLAQIAREAMNNKTFRKIVSTKTYSIPMDGEKWDRALKNHNKMLWRYDGCNGVKTGFTKRCGRCLVTSASRNNESYICVTLNAPDDWNDHEAMLDSAFTNYTVKQIVKKGVKLCDFTYDSINKRKCALISEQDFSVAVSSNDTISTDIEYKKIKIPAKKGTICAKMNIYCNGTLLKSIDLVSKTDIRGLTFIEKLKSKFFT